MTVEEFEFYRKVRTYYCNVSFSLTFTYPYSYRHRRKASAEGVMNCSVNAHSQTVEYFIDLRSDIIERPGSEKSSFLFASVYDQIPPQRIEWKDYSILKQRYRVPITYDWQEFIVSGAETAINRKTMQNLLRKWKLQGTGSEHVDADLKVVKVEIDWDSR